MKKKILLGVLILGVVVGGFGIYKFIQLQTRMYNTIILQNRNIVILQDFIEYTFSDQVKVYLEALKQKESGVSTTPLPANEIPN